MTDRKQLPGWTRPLFRPQRYKVLYGGRGGAKCLALGTRVWMADGTMRAVEDVRVGDLVMGPDSTARLVLSTTRGHGPMYVVRQTSGMDYVVNGDHLLSLKKSESAKRERRIMPSGNPRSPRGRYPDWPDVVHVTAAQFAAQSQRWRENFRGYRAGVLRFPEQSVKIDPYLLGVWLGDGTGREMRITSADREVIESCAMVAAAHGGSISVRRKPGQLAADIGFRVKCGRLNPIWEGFKYYGLPNNKRIPQQYLANSEGVRLQLLAGLIDSDGHCHHNGYAIAQVNQVLAFDIKRLADSLGFRTSIRRKATLCTNNGKRGFAWYVYINGDTWRVPSRVPRKRIERHNVHKNKDFALSQISVEPVGNGAYAGFTLDGDHLFVLEDGTVTHNSWSVARVLLILASATPLRILCTRELQTSIRDSVHQLLRDQIQAMGLPGFQVTEREIRHVNGSLFIFEGLRFNVTKIKSLEGVDIAWVEEAERISSVSWDVLIPTIRKDGSEIIVTFNPDRQEDSTYQRFVVNAPPTAWVRKVGWEDNPWFPAPLKAEKDYLYRVDPEAAAHVWGGTTRQASDAQILRGKWFVEEFTPGPTWQGPYQGMDFGFAVDPTTLVRCWVAERVLYVEHELYRVGLELDDTAQAALNAIPDVAKYATRADSARPETISYLKRHGLPRLEGVKKWAGSVEDGIAHLRQYERIVIHPRCKNAISEARLYSYKVDARSGDVLPVVLGANDHCIDSIRYAIGPLIKDRDTGIEGVSLFSEERPSPWEIQ